MTQNYNDKVEFLWDNGKIQNYNVVIKSNICAIYFIVLILSCIFAKQQWRKNDLISCLVRVRENKKNFRKQENKNKVIKLSKKKKVLLKLLSFNLKQCKQHIMY